MKKKKIDIFNTKTHKHSEAAGSRSNYSTTGCLCLMLQIQSVLYCSNLYIYVDVHRVHTVHSSIMVISLWAIVIYASTVSVQPVTVSVYDVNLHPSIFIRLSVTGYNFVKIETDDEN